MTIFTRIYRRILAFFRSPPVAHLVDEVHAVVTRLEDAAKRHAADAISHSRTAQKFIALEQKAKAEVDQAEHVVANIKSFIKQP
jgi:tRNA U34 5-methylaminomethyl-2-thiouridine-forming methyltransferase MnmC